MVDLKSQVAALTDKLSKAEAVIELAKRYRKDCCWQNEEDFDTAIRTYREESHG